MEDEEYKRQAPEAFLELAKEEEAGKTRGKLTIYFGYAPGVGKTYGMLTDARADVENGADLVIGYYEIHRRTETASLVLGLELIPLLSVDYKGITLREMDLEKILARKPHVAVVDELAHTNAPGSRHLKRYQDVEELLNAGIDVYTTLNVQHLESLNDILFNTIGIRVRETVPDTFFALATEVKLADIPPEELLDRLAKGKVYVKDMAEHAVQRFFQMGNLMSLREMSLRLVADRVDAKMIQYERAHAVERSLSTREVVLVGVYASPYSEQLVRSAYRLASALDGEWIALHVETQDGKSLTEQEQSWLTRAMDIAKDLGARVVWMKGANVVDEIIQYAHDNHVTKIVLGKPQKGGVLGLRPFRIRKIFANTPGIDIHLFDAKGEETIPKKRFVIRPLNYLISAVAVIAFSILGFLVRDILGEVNLLFFMLLPVVGSALLMGRGASMISAILSVLIFDYLFVRPYFTFSISDFAYFLSFGIYIAVVFVISNLAHNARHRVLQLRESEARSSALYRLSQDLATSRNLDEMISVVISHSRLLFPCEVAIFLPEGTQLALKGVTASFQVNPKEVALATWVWTNGKPAGTSTDTLPDAWAYYLPMATANKVDGVIGFRFENSRAVLTPENKIVLDTIARLGALVIERMRASE